MDNLRVTLFIFAFAFSLSKNAVKGTADSVSSDENIRRQMCPNVPLDENIWNYGIFREKNECFEFSNSKQGPCPPNMVFCEESDKSLYGICDCKYEENQLIYIFHNDTNQCYQMFDQAYCGSGHWLTLSKTSKVPVCEENPCVTHTISYNQDLDENDKIVDVQFNGECFEMLKTEHDFIDAGTKSCGSKSCMTLLFTRDKILPICDESRCMRYSDEYEMYSHAVGVINPFVHECQPGSSRSLSGACQSSWNW